MRRCLLITCVLLVGCGDEYEKGTVLQEPTPTVIVEPAPPVATTTQQQRPQSPSEHSELELSADERRLVRKASPAARQFLAGYLPYTYGRGSALRIRHTTAELRRRLDRSAPRVIAGQREARPRLRSLEPSGFRDGRVILLATASDGSTTYPIALTLEERRGRWIVIEAR